MTAGDLFQAGDLTGAIDAATSQVRANPMDTSARWLLGEFLCFAGELERADKQLEVIGNQDTQAVAVVSLFRQLIRAETARQEFYQQGRVPEFFNDPGPAVNLALEASVYRRSDEFAVALDLAEKAEDARSAVGGECDEEAFSDLRDQDDLLSCVFEVCTPTGKYYHVPTDQVRSIVFRKTERPRDLLWRPVEMDVINGPQGEAWIPCLYFDSEQRSRDDLRLGRATDWLEEPGQPVRGIGQKMLWIGDAEKGIRDITEIRFDVAEAPVDAISE